VLLNPTAALTVSTFAVFNRNIHPDAAILCTVENAVAAPNRIAAALLEHIDHSHSTRTATVQVNILPK
jgi:hypothetical protein